MTVRRATPVALPASPAMTHRKPQSSRGAAGHRAGQTPGAPELSCSPHQWGPWAATEPSVLRCRLQGAGHGLALPAGHSELPSAWSALNVDHRSEQNLM